MLEYYRVVRGWSFKELSTNTNIGISTIRNIISGKTKISFGSIQKLAKTFGTTENFWLNLDN